MTRFVVQCVAVGGAVGLICCAALLCSGGSAAPSARAADNLPAPALNFSTAQVELIRAVDGHDYLVATPSVGYSGLAMIHAVGCKACTAASEE